MSEQLSSDSFDAALEADMRRLAGEVIKAREHPENKNITEQELLKQSIRAFTPQAGAAAPLVQATTSSPLSEDAENASPETKLEIEYLLEIALHQGIQKANAAAQKTSPFVLDAFHDMLVGKLYPELKRRGLL